MKRLNLTVMSILLALIIAPPLMAASHGREKGPAKMHGMRHHDRAGWQELFAKLNLTAEQKAKIKSLHKAHLREIKPLKDQIFSKLGDLKLLWMEDNPDKAKLMAVHKELRAVRDQVADKNIAHRLEVFSILTPEQKDKVREGLADLGAGCCKDMMEPDHHKGMGGPCKDCKEQMGE